MRLWARREVNVSMYATRRPEIRSAHATRSTPVCGISNGSFGGGPGSVAAMTTGGVDDEDMAEEDMIELLDIEADVLKDDDDE